MPNRSPDEIHDEQEVKRRFEAALRALLNSAPKPMKDMPRRPCRREDNPRSITGGYAILHRRPLLAALPALLARPAAAQETRAGDVAVQQPWTRAAGQGATAAGFMAISNRGAAADRLLSASSPAARALELHSMVRDGDVMRMRPMEAIEIRPGQTVTLRPGGLHLMLIGLSQPLRQGETVTVTLRFERAGEMQVALPVQAAGAREPVPHGR